MTAPWILVAMICIGNARCEVLRRTYWPTHRACDLAGEADTAHVRQVARGLVVVTCKTIGDGP